MLFTISSVFAEIEVSGHIDLDSEFYLNKESSRESNSFTAKQTLELKYLKDDYTVFTKLYAQAAYNDSLHENKQTKRSFVRIDEFYVKHDGEDSSAQVGKSIKFWGALELRNIVDVFNPNELRDDMFSVNKLGVYNASYAYFTDNGEVSLILKVHEQDQKMAQHPYVYYPFPYVYYPFPLAISYEKELQTSKNKNRPSLYITYSASTDSEYALDYAFIYENGYDSQRYFSAVLNQPTRYVQNAYMVDKFMTYNTLVIGATLLKVEALYTDVQANTFVGDYSHFALGIEHTFEDLGSGAAIGFISEYYKYTTYESDKYNDLQLYETMQDDLFLGLRYVLNDADDSSIVGGAVVDMEYDEQMYYAKYESRFGDSIKVECDYYYIEPSKKAQTAYALLGRHQRIGVNIAYYF